jgi:hypothetical protein
MIDPFNILREELVRAAGRVPATDGAPTTERRRQRWRLGRVRRRSHPLAVVLAALVITGSAAATVFSLTASPSQPLAGKVPGAIEPASMAGYRYKLIVTPGLDAGSAFWSAAIRYSGPPLNVHGAVADFAGVGGGYPTQTNPLFGGSGVEYIGQFHPREVGDTVGFLLTGPRVAAVRIGARTIRTVSSADLPAGDRAAVLFLPSGSPMLVAGWSPGMPVRSIMRVPPEPGYKGPTTIPTLAVLPLASNGEVIPTKPTPPYGSFPRFWQAPTAITPGNESSPYHGPSHPLPGVCELTQRGLPALTPEWGHAISSISPARDSQGELFLSCIDTEYFLHGWPLQAAALLDARHPGRVLGPIPGARPVPGHAGMVDLESGQLTAKRIGNAWLVVQGGASLAQRMQVLEALQIAKLEVNHKASGFAPH